jgi:hypothetical protein
MGPRMRIRPSFILLLAVLTVSQISAQSSEMPFARGIYLAAAGHYSTVNGGFDGQSFYTVGGTETLIVPKISPGFGGGGLLGYRGANWAYEAGGSYRANGGSWLGSPYDTSSLEFTFDVQWLPFAATNVQPYLSAGLGISTLTVKNGSSGLNPTGDALYYLGGFRIGLGVEAWVTKRIFIRLQGIYRVDRVVSLQGVDDKDRVDLHDALNADGYELSLIFGSILF